MSDKHPKHWIFRFIDIQNKHGPARFKEANKREYVQVYPNLSDTIKNINWGIPFSYGCQMVFMNYGTRDDFMKSYQDHFKRKSFVLKPRDLRYIPITVEEPADQDPALSYAAASGPPAAIADSPAVSLLSNVDMTAMPNGN